MIHPEKNILKTVQKNKKTFVIWWTQIFLSRYLKKNPRFALTALRGELLEREREREYLWILIVFIVFINQFINKLVKQTDLKIDGLKKGCKFLWDVGEITFLIIECK